MKTFFEYSNEKLDEGMMLYIPKVIAASHTVRLKNIQSKIKSAGDIERKIELLGEQNVLLGEMMAAGLLGLERKK